MRSLSIAFIVLTLGTLVPAQQTSDCKPVERYGVKGCEVRSDGTCPAGYHKQPVNPPNPQMAAPTFLMCVADKQQQKEEKPKQEKPDSPQKHSR